MSDFIMWFIVSAIWVFTLRAQRKASRAEITRLQELNKKYWEALTLSLQQLQEAGSSMLQLNDRLAASIAAEQQLRDQLAEIEDMDNLDPDPNVRTRITNSMRELLAAAETAQTPDGALYVHLNQLREAQQADVAFDIETVPSWRTTEHNITINVPDDLGGLHVPPEIAERVRAHLANTARQRSLTYALTTAKASEELPPTPQRPKRDGRRKIKL